MNEWQQAPTVSETQGTAEWATAPEAEPLGDAVKAASAYAVEVEPEAAAKARNAARETGLPFDIALRKKEYLEKERRRAEMAAAAAASPPVARVLADPEVATIAQDDLSALSILGDVGMAFVRTGGALLSAVPRVNQGIWGIVRAGADVAGADGVADYAAAQAKGQGAAAETVNPKTGNWLLDAARGGIASTGQTLLMMPFGPAGVVGSMAATEGGSSYTEARDKGASVGNALQLGATNAVAEAVTEKFAVGKLFSDLAKRTGFATLVKNQLMRELPGEQIATLWQDFNEWALVNPEKTVAEFAAERPGRFAETLVSTLVSVGATSTAAHGAAAAAEARTAKAARAQDDAQRIGELFAGSESSKLRARDPEAFHRFMADATTSEEGDAAQIYVDGVAFAQTLEQAGVTPEQLPQALGEQIMQAAATGNDVVLPVADVANLFAGTPIAEALTQHMRTTPEAMSLAEAMTFGQNEQGLFQQAVEDAIGKASSEAGHATMVDEVKQIVLDQLNTAGRFSPEVNDLNATLVASMYATQSAKLGIAPKALYDQHPLRVVGENPAAPGHVLNQESPEFKAWFGDSKIVDESGAPLVMYHGTKGDFESFDAERQGQSDFGASGRGFYFSQDAGTANVYATLSPAEGAPNIVPVYLSMRNPYEMGAMLPTNEQESRALTEAVKAAGHDGIIVRGADGKMDEAVVFNPEQIKSKFNRGTFDPKDANILNQSATPALAQDSPEFKAWFGDSKVVDGSGAPLVVYHGTNNDFERFAPETRSGKTGNPNAQLGHFFTDAPAEASRYAMQWQEAGGNVRPMYLAIRNPYVMPYKEFDGLATAAYRNLLADPDYDPNETIKFGDREGQRKAAARLTKHEESAREQARARRDELIAEGYDGIIAKVGGVTEYVAFHPEQIKSKFNRGTFDPKDANILNQSATPALADVRQQWADAGIKNAMSERGGTIHLSQIVVPKDARGSGKGTAAMQALVDYADSTGQRVTLSPSSDFGGSKTRLVEFYKRFGFVQNKGRNKDFEISESMYRPAQVLDANNPSILNQSARGTFNPSTLTIALLEKANLSTFLHEVGHFGLEMMVDIASRPDAPQTTVDDVHAILAWFGVDSLQTWQAMTLEQQRAHHEKFAEGFETYLFEGKAPSSALAAPFARFRAWLLNVYKSLTGMRVQLTDEVRGVFDRMLATNEQIEEQSKIRNMAPLFASAEQAGMTPEQWAAYHETGAEAAREAVSDLSSRTLRDMKWLTNAKGRALKALQKQAEGLRKAVREEVEAEVDAMPVYEAMGFLRGADPGEKLSRAALRAMYGDGDKALWTHLDRKLSTEKGGVPPDVAATAFGFDSGDALMRAILAAEPREELVEGLTDQRMLERHGEVADQVSLERAAEAAIHNEARTRFVATELHALQAAMNPREKVGEARVTTGKAKGSTRNLTVNALAAAAGQYARQVVDRTVVRKLDAQQAARAGAKEAALAKAALAKGDVARALTHKRNQLLHERTSRAMSDARTEAETLQAYLAKFRNSNRARGAIDADYVEQIDGILAAIDTRQSSNVRLDRMAKLRKWVEKQEAAGLPVALDLDLLESLNVTHVRDMTVEGLRALVDQVKSIEHLGKLKKRLLTAKDAREFDAAAEDVAATIRQHGGKARPVPFNPSAHENAARKGWDAFFAQHRKFASYARQMDGGADNGVLWNTFVRSMNEAGDSEAAMIERSTVELGKIFAPLEKLAGGLTGDKRVVATIGKSLSRGERLAVALNWGNEANRSRVLNTLSQAQVDDVFSMLTRAELRAVQQVWDHLESYWPAMAAKEKRVTGTVPEKVAAEPFTVQLADGSSVDMKGGYYPIVYESELSDMADAHQQAQIAKDMLAGAYSRASTRRGHLKKRAEKVGEPLTWSLTPITRHLSQAIHDLSWHEWVIDAGRLLKDERVSSAIREHYGVEALRAMRKTVESIATDDLVTSGAVERASLWLRATATAATMGWSLTTALLQPFGLTQSMARIGPVWVLRGLVHWAGDAAKMESAVRKIGEKSTFMRLRAKTFNREVSEVMGRLHTGKSQMRQITEASAFMLMQKMQLVADVPTWYGGYEKALAEGHPEASAVALADQAVIDSQGGGQLKDLAGVQRGGVLNKLMSVFYSYFSATWNLVAEASGNLSRNPASPKAIAGWLSQIALLVVLPAMGPEIVKEILRGGDGDDEPEEFMKRRLQDLAGYSLGMLVFVRELSGLASGFDYAGPAFTRAIADFVKAGKTAGDMATKDSDEWTESQFRKVVKGILTPLGLPATQIDRTWRGWRAYEEGEAGAGAILLGPPAK